jgi:sialic acid synthase SpsE
MVKKLELPHSDFLRLKEYCDMKQIIFMSTPDDLESAIFLSNLQNIFKIGSGAVTDLHLLRYVGGLKKSIILSTGMATINEIKDALEVLERAGTPKNRITILHCTSEYPAPMSDVNLRAMSSMGETFGTEVGYSDHTLGIEVATAAVALGATVIEKHFTLDVNLPGPDHIASLNPIELKSMISAIRNIELAMGDGVKRVMPSEIENRTVVRKAIVASRAIGAGELFTADNITTKRAGDGISPMRWDEVLGMTAIRSFSEEELIEL